MSIDATVPVLGKRMPADCDEPEDSQRRRLVAEKITTTVERTFALPCPWWAWQCVNSSRPANTKRC